MEVLRQDQPPVMCQYSPHRDIALIGVDLLITATKESTPERLAKLREAERDLYTVLQVDSGQVVGVHEVLGNAIVLLVQGRCEKISEALTQVGFFELSAESRTLALAKLGQVFFRAFAGGLQNLAEGEAATLGNRNRYLQEVAKLHDAFEELQHASRARRLVAWFRQTYRGLAYALFGPRHRVDRLRQDRPPVGDRVDDQRRSDHSE